MQNKATKIQKLLHCWAEFIPEKSSILGMAVDCITCKLDSTAPHSRTSCTHVNQFKHTLQILALTISIIGYFDLQ